MKSTLFDVFGILNSIAIPTLFGMLLSINTFIMYCIELFHAFLSFFDV